MFNIICFFRFNGLVLMVPVEIHVGNQNVMFQPCSVRPLKKGKHNTCMVTMVHTSCNYGVQNLKQYQVPSSTDVMSTCDAKRRKVDKDDVGNR